MRCKVIRVIRRFMYKGLQAFMVWLASMASYGGEFSNGVVLAIYPLLFVAR